MGWGSEVFHQELDVAEHGGRKKYPKAIEKRVNELYASRLKIFFDVWCVQLGAVLRYDPFNMFLKNHVFI